MRSPEGVGDAATGNAATGDGEGVGVLDADGEGSAVGCPGCVVSAHPAASKIATTAAAPRLCMAEP